MYLKELRTAVWQRQCRKQSARHRLWRQALCPGGVRLAAGWSQSRLPVPVADGGKATSLLLEQREEGEFNGAPSSILNAPRA